MCPNHKSSKTPSTKFGASDGQDRFLEKRFYKETTSFQGSRPTIYLHLQSTEGPSRIWLICTKRFLDFATRTSPRSKISAHILLPVAVNFHQRSTVYTFTLWPQPRKLCLCNLDFSLNPNCVPLYKMPRLFVRPPTGQTHFR